MKITIDTDNHTVAIYEDPNIGKLVDTLSELLPDTWKTYRIIFIDSPAKNPLYTSHTPLF